MDKPNLLIIQTDQQALWTMGCYGGKLIETPYTDRISKEGVKFNHFYTPSAVCTPSRGCFLTGKYPHSHGAYRNNVPLFNDVRTLAHELVDAGYHTGYIGKWHLDGSASPGFIQEGHSMGFMDYTYMFNRSHAKKVIEKDNGELIFTMEKDADETNYMTDYLTDRAIDFMEKQASKPFFLMLSIPDPHGPYEVRTPYNTMYQEDNMPIPDTFWEERLPDWAEYDEWGRENDLFTLKDKNRENLLKNCMAQYCGEVKCIDDNMGKLLAFMEQKGILDNTIIVYTSDHGDYMGEHGLTGKNNIYDSVYNIPLLIRWKNHIAEGSEVNNYVTVGDIQQTILSMLGLASNGREQGRDASQLFLGNRTKEQEWEDVVYLHPNDVPRSGIITPEYELAYVGKGWKRDFEFTEHVLFDRKKDPKQKTNLFFDEAYLEIIESLTKKILQHYKKVGVDDQFLPSVLKEQYK